MGKQIILDEDYLLKSIEESAKKMVGESMAHFETGNTNLDSIKKSVKNSIWQNFRDFAVQLKAFNEGVKFVTPKTDK